MHYWIDSLLLINFNRNIKIDFRQLGVTGPQGQSQEGQIKQLINLAQQAQILIESTDNYNNIIIIHTRPDLV